QHTDVQPWIMLRLEIGLARAFPDERWPHSPPETLGREYRRHAYTRHFLIATKGGGGRLVESARDDQAWRPGDCEGCLAWGRPNNPLSRRPVGYYPGKEVPHAAAY